MKINAEKHRQENQGINYHHGIKTIAYKVNQWVELKQA